MPAVGDGTLGSEEMLVVPHHQMRHPQQNQLVATRASIRLVRPTHRADLPDRSVRPGVHPTRPAQHTIDGQLRVRLAIGAAAWSAAHWIHCRARRPYCAGLAQDALIGGRLIRPEPGQRTADRSHGPAVRPQ